MRIQHIRRARAVQHVQSVSHTRRCGCLRGDWCLTKLTLGRSMHARSAKGRYCGSVYSSRLCIFSPLPLAHHAHSPFWRHSHITYTAPFTSLTDVPREKLHWKTATDGATPLQPLSQAKLHRTAHPTSPHPTQPTPRGLSPSSGSPRQAFFQKGLLLLLLHHYRCVYRFIAALSVLIQHQHRTLLALISGPL